MTDTFFVIRKHNISNIVNLFLISETLSVYTYRIIKPIRVRYFCVQCQRLQVIMKYIIVIYNYARRGHRLNDLKLNLTNVFSAVQELAQRRQ